MAILLSEIAALIDGARLIGSDQVVHGISHDSRKVEPGFVFAAMKGSNQNGYNFIQTALNMGAVGIVVAQANLDTISLLEEISILIVPSVRQNLGIISCAIYDNPSKKINLVGITGTNGKTTTSFLLDSALSASGIRTGVIGTIEVRSANKRYGSTYTTPEAPDLQAVLAEMVENDVETASMEVSSHGIDQMRIEGTSFRIGIFTNLSPEHLDYHGTMEQYYYAKSRLFEANRCGFVIINIDDTWGRRLAHQVQVPRVTFGTSADADYRIENTKVSTDGTKFSLIHKDSIFDLSTHIVGSINALNATAAFIAATELGAPAEVVIQGISQCSSVDGRFQLVEAGQPSMVVVDYAHTPDSIANLISTVRSLLPPNGKVFAVGGARGGRDRLKRPSLGAALASADCAILTTDNPGNEDPEAIITQLLLGTLDMPPQKVHIELSRSSAIEYAVMNACESDGVVIVGRGHETTIRIGETTSHLDDREEVARAARLLAAKNKSDFNSTSQLSQSDNCAHA